MSTIHGAPPTHPMLSVGPSDILRQVRANFIEGSMRSYEPTMDKMINLINDYIGEDEAQEKAISQDNIRFSPENLFLSEVQKYKKKRMLTIEDRRHAVDWVRNIVASQKRHAKLLPPVTLVPGDSEGITFVITKAKKIYGFLYGTMHNFSRGLLEAEILTHLSLSTQINLLNCAIIGTEITIKEEPNSNSVEGPLMAIADKCGIVNIGIDDATCDRNMVGRTIAWAADSGLDSVLRREEPKFKELDPIEELACYLNGAKDARTLHRITTIAVHSGIIELAWSAALSRDGEEDVYQNTLQKRRNQSMADNIDTLLSSCEVIGDERGEEMPPRCFFAIGISHLMPTPAIQESVVELVAKKGWRVERLVPKEARLAASREMTARETRSIGELLVNMNRHPLYTSQKPYLPNA